MNNNSIIRVYQATTDIQLINATIPSQDQITWSGCLDINWLETSI